MKKFKAKATHKTRFVGLKYEEEASSLRAISLFLSRSTRKKSISDRIKLRRIIDSLHRNADRLEGKA